MITLMLGVGMAAELQGTVFGAPFEVGEALGLTDPATPGVLQIAFLSSKMSCDDVRALRGGGKRKPKKMPTLVMAVFPAPAPGVQAAQVLAMGKDGLGGFTGSVTLQTVPSDVGATGTVELDLTGAGALGDEGAAARAAKDALKGVGTYRLCDAIVARPDLAGTVFEPGTYRIEEKSVFPGEPPTVLEVSIALPKGWTAGTGPVGAPQWKAPDGTTLFELSLASPSDPMVEGLEQQTQSQVKAFQTEATTGEMVRAESLGEGTYVAHWRFRWGDGPWTNQLDVFRQDPAWDYQVRCTVTGDDTAVSQVFADAEKACAGIAPL